MKNTKLGVFERNVAGSSFPLVTQKSQAVTAGQLRAHLINSDGGPQLEGDWCLTID